MTVLSFSVELHSILYCFIGNQELLSLGISMGILSLSKLGERVCFRRGMKFSNHIFQIFTWKKIGTSQKDVVVFLERWQKIICTPLSIQGYSR